MILKDCYPRRSKISFFNSCNGCVYWTFINCCKQIWLWNKNWKIYNNIDIESKGNTLFASLAIVKSQKEEELDSSLIKKRRTSRTKYDEISVDDSVLEELKSEAELYENKFYYTKEESKIKFIKKINQEALFYDLANDDIRNELDNLFRYSKENAEVKKDGLWSKCMGFGGGLLRSVFKNMRDGQKDFEIVLKTPIFHLLMEHPQYVGTDQI